MTEDIVAFLEARIGEDEAKAERWRDIENTTRALREVEAKRRILDRFIDLSREVFEAEAEGDYEAAPVATAFAYECVVGQLTAIYSDHPDYNEEWRTT